LTEQVYNRARAVAYAQKWAFSRNPAFLNFDGMGGDCTNFASQCLYTGSGIMNYTDTFGWYYRSSRDRSPSWTGVPYLYNFLISNKSVGPYAVQTDAQQVLPGDLVQLGTAAGQFYHSPVIVAADGDDIYVAAHTDDAYMRPLSSYTYDQARFLHIVGVRHW